MAVLVAVLVFVWMGVGSCTGVDNCLGVKWLVVEAMVY